MNLTKQLSILIFFYVLVFCQGTPLRNICSDMLINLSSCVVQPRPLTLVPHFNDSEPLFLHTVSSQCIEISFLNAAFDIVFRERWTYLLTGTEEVKAAHCFENSGALRSKPINTETISFLLSTFSVEAFNFTFCSCSLKIGHDHFFKPTGLVLTRSESTWL